MARESYYSQPIADRIHEVSLDVITVASCTLSRLNVPRTKTNNIRKRALCSPIYRVTQSPTELYFYEFEILFEFKIIALMVSYFLQILLGYL